MPTTAESPKPPAFSLDTVGYVIFFVKDVRACLAFYRDVLGMKVKLDGGEHWSELETKGGLTLALHGCSDDKPPRPGGCEVVFSVPDVLAAREALAARGVAVEKPKVVFEAGPEMRGVSCIFRDPAGNLLSVFGLAPKSRLQE